MLVKRPVKYLSLAALNIRHKLSPEFTFSSFPASSFLWINFLTEYEIKANQYRSASSDWKRIIQPHEFKQNFTQQYFKERYPWYSYLPFHSPLTKYLSEVYVWFLQANWLPLYSFSLPMLIHSVIETHQCRI